MLGRAGRIEEDPNLAALRQEVYGWLKTIENVRQEFRRPDAAVPAAELFRMYRNSYTDLANRLTTYLRKERNPYFNLFRRSQGAAAAAKRASDEATTLATLFSKYQKSPKQYDWVKADRAFHDLQIALENLYDWLAT